jgi:hypothetical protein
MGAGGAAKQIVDSLLARFLPLARRRIETAQAQVSCSLSPLRLWMIPRFHFPTHAVSSGRCHSAVQKRLTWQLGDKASWPSVGFEIAALPLPLPIVVARLPSIQGFLANFFLLQSLVLHS